MKFKIFTLYPDIFTSFLSTSLIARGISKDIIQVNTINWRNEFGIGVHRQVDDKPFGGGTGMVLQCGPIYQSLLQNNALGVFFEDKKDIYPNNSKFYEHWKINKNNKVTINLTPKGHVINQDTLYWLSNFKEINILCGRFEGFDDRVNNLVDLELSIGDYVLNGGEIGAMVLIEGVSRLVPDFITKGNSVDHDSFSKHNNYYFEHQEYSKLENIIKDDKEKNLFDDKKWFEKINLYEHPVYTRPQIWKNLEVPEILINGDHKKIQKWKLDWYKK
jgi:tRNA (guanine37-N1)-methyltransferase